VDFHQFLTSLWEQWASSFLTLLWGQWASSFTIYTLTKPGAVGFPAIRITEKMLTLINTIDVLVYVHRLLGVVVCLFILSSFNMITITLFITSSFRVCLVGGII